MENQQAAARFSLPQLAPASGDRILLLDSNAESRNSRANAMRLRGALVDCAASSMDARSLWKPGSHRLVLIDFRGAERDNHEFYSYAQAACATQAFGFYTRKPPFVTTSLAACESVAEEEEEESTAPMPATIDSSPAASGTAPADQIGVGLAEAARRIATIRRLTRSRPAGPADPEARRLVVSSSDAISIAERVLGGIKRA